MARAECGFLLAGMPYSRFDEARNLIWTVRFLTACRFSASKTACSRCGSGDDELSSSLITAEQGTICKVITNTSILVTGWLLLVLTQAGCSQVQVLRLTSETFPSRAVSDVEILSHQPDTSFLKIAELSESASSDVQTLQRHLLKKAADLGADAVVFSTPLTRTEQRTDYQPVYSPWSYYAPYYYGPGPYGYWGPWGYRYGSWGPAWGASQYAAVSYTVRITILKGVALKYR